MKDEKREKFVQVDTVVGPDRRAVTEIGRYAQQVGMVAGDHEGQTFTDVLVVAAMMGSALGVKRDAAHAAFADCMVAADAYLDWMLAQQGEAEGEPADADG